MLNGCLSVLYYVFFLFFLSSGKSSENGIVDFFSTVFKILDAVIYYNWIHVLWVGIIIFGLIKRNKELSQENIKTD